MKSAKAHIEYGRDCRAKHEPRDPPPRNRQSAATLNSRREKGTQVDPAVPTADQPCRESEGASFPLSGRKPAGPPAGTRTAPALAGGPQLRRPRRHRARLSREEQRGKALLGDDGQLARRSGQSGRAERLLRGGVLPQERQNLRAEPAASLHHEGDELRVRVALGLVPLPLVLLPLARRLPGGPL